MIKPPTAASGESNAMVTVTDWWYGYNGVSIDLTECDDGIKYVEFFCE